ncbi:hypothetical protein Fcan01_27034 [Folsomia candida]|uniref:Uncharacterized protein n=1 Tax=Folsomia candida TaxID=158441 RepID=A0A226D075_FOLCA|nr:hypothetical protein Fcan01_27034 [Folsomia candida]
MTDIVLKKSCVVEFPVDKTIEVVPRTWLSDNNTKCAFPSNRPKGFKKNQEDPESMSDPLWKIWEANVKKSYDKFERANDKAKKLLKAAYIDSSDLDIDGESSQERLQSAGEVIQPFESPINEKTEQEVESIPVTSDYCDDRITTLIEEFRAFQQTSIQNQLILQEEIRDLKNIVLRCLNSTNPAAATNAVRQFFIQAGNTEGIKAELSDSKLDSYIAKWLRDSINRGDEGKQKRSKAKNGRATVNKVPESEETAVKNVEPN